MFLINGAIPLLIGILLIKNPEFIYYGTSKKPTEEKKNNLRKWGKILVVVGIGMALVGFLQTISG